MEEHQGEEPARLRLVGEQRHHDPCQPDSLGTQLAPDQRIARRRRVALVEHEVEHPQDAIEPFRQQLGGWHSVGDARVADLALGADEALGEGRLGDEECPGDLRRRQAAQRAQRQGDPGVHRERRMAAREDQPQSIVRDVHGVLRRTRFDGLELRLHRRLASQDLGLLDEPLPAPEPVDRPVAGGRRDPGTRVVRHAPRWPGLQRADERILDGLLGEVEIAGHPDERGDGPALLLAEQAVDDLVGGVRTGQRPAIVPGVSSRPMPPPPGPAPLIT